MNMMYFAMFALLSQSSMVYCTRIDINSERVALEMSDRLGIARFGSHAKNQTPSLSDGSGDAVKGHLVLQGNGKGGSSCLANTKVANTKGDKIGVRCCSDRLSKDDHRNESGGEVWRKNVDCHVWGASLFRTDDTPTRDCQRSKTFEEAHDICEQNGGRLCTPEELIGRCTKGTGCGFDRSKVWTSTPCHPDHLPDVIETCKKAVLTPCQSENGYCPVFRKARMHGHGNCKKMCEETHQTAIDTMIQSLNDADPNLGIEGKFAMAGAIESANSNHAFEAIMREHIIKCVCVHLSKGTKANKCYEGGQGIGPDQKWCQFGYQMPSWRIESSKPSVLFDFSKAKKKEELASAPSSDKKALKALTEKQNRCTLTELIKKQEALVKKQEALIKKQEGPCDGYLPEPLSEKLCEGVEGNPFVKIVKKKGPVKKQKTEYLPEEVKLPGAQWTYTKEGNVYVKRCQDGKFRRPADCR